MIVAGVAGPGWPGRGGGWPGARGPAVPAAAVASGQGTRAARLIDGVDECAGCPRPGRYVSQSTRSIFPYSGIFMITVPHPRHMRVRDRDHQDTPVAVRQVPRLMHPTGLWARP